MLSLHKKMLFLLGCSVLVGSFSYGTSSEVLAEEIAETPLKSTGIYESDFTNELGQWQDVIGKSDKTISSNGMVIGNTKQGTNLESVSLNLSSGISNSGDLEYTFVYEGQTNFGVVFRGDVNDSKKWQSFAYTRDGQWQLGQPGGKWITTITGIKLISGQRYKLMVRYEGKSIKAFLNDQLLYENEEVVYPNTSASIDGDWEGYVGIRLFGNLSRLTVLSMRSGPVGSIPVDNATSDYAKLKDKWKNQLVSDQYDETNAMIVNYVQKLSEEADQLYQALNKEPNRTYLWPVEQGNTPSADLTTQFTKLQKLALAYGTKGSKFYQDSQIATEIEAGLDFMVTQKGYDGKKYHGNWWDWQIGVPQKFVGILMILGDKIPQAKQQQYTAAMSGYVPDPFKQLYTKAQGTFVDLAFIPNFVTSGANRTDLAQTVLALGILQENEGKISQASSSIVDVFKLVTKGDGFYQDGSFIQHNNIPYTGSYGNVLMKGVGQILAITKDSKFEMAPDIVQSFVANVDRAFIPLIYQGEMLPLVNGRSISRAPAKTKVGYGSTTLYNLLIVSKFAPAEYQTKFKEAVKHWMKENPTYYLTNARDYNDLQMTMSLLNDSSIIGDALSFIGSKMYASMDRFVQRTPNYMLGLSMYSSRISSFEAGNKENKRGWHTADGMMYLYNDDKVQFNSAYWPTVDPYRLPGTTVDTVPLKDEISAFTTVTSKEKWVGGVELDDQAVVGMSLNKTGTKNNGTILPMNLQGKKSWFVVDGQIVALGAGIKGSTTASIETIVDNRLLNDDYVYQVLSNNGIVQQEKERSSKEWLLLQSDHQNANIGYYFPENTIVDVISDVRSGTYAQINEAFPSDDVYTGNYRKFVIDHGKNPTNEQYVYVILPGIDQADLKAYAAEKPVAILANSADIQAVELKKANYLGVNIWKETGGSVAGITSNKAVSLLRKNNEGKKTYVLSDPTQSNAVMTITLPNDFTKVITLSEGITYDEATKTFTLRFEGSGGNSKQIIVE